VITYSNTAQAPDMKVKDDELYLKDLIRFLLRNYKLILHFSGWSSLVFFLYALSQPQLWSGKFEMLIDVPENQNLSFKQARNLDLQPAFSKTNIFNFGDYKKFLESPLVLLPVYNSEFVMSSSSCKKQNITPFKSWIKKVKVDVESGSSILTVSYVDNNRDCIIPIMNSLVKQYTRFTQNERRLSLDRSIAYLKGSIPSFATIAKASMRRSQVYAITHNLELGEIVAERTGASSLEERRQQAQAKVMLLDQQLLRARSASNSFVFQSPQLEANADLYKQYQAVEARLSDLRSRLRDNDELVLSLKRQRQSLIATLNSQTVGLLEGEKATAQAALISASRPKEIVLKYRDLVSQALRDQKTLAALQDQFQALKLEQAKQDQPWQIISKPSLLERPVAPKKGQLMVLGMFAGFLAGCCYALLVDRRSDRVFSQEELQQLLPGPPLANLTPQAMSTEVSLLAFGALAGSHRVALVPVGLAPNASSVQRLLSQLKEKLPDTEFHCSTDLAKVADCDQQLLVTSLGYVTRNQLSNLRQQLNLQGRPITAWLLLNA